ncbi:NAD(P)-binding protein [Aspergillus ruber CBS 135680]|uniref:NAD(P)-binding protein n=1 Tax=Aspergillus ruber (strain CBS 135680) TaxID=1388766 RepID=A0A017SLD8_ASPRC|nr:NAD(P)-binding protein [Aspergillus ruber CBS 135680]EYE97767.1 NAD(P)-binding protein [Aspergillus ruber CBS 135680]
MHLPEHFILFLNPVRHAIYFLQQLPKIARTELVTSKSRDEFFSDLQGKYKDITIIYRTSVSGAITGKFEADLIHHLLATCNYICHNGAGYDQMTSMHAQKKGLDFGHNQQGRILNILGMERIGCAIKKRVEPFIVQTRYHNPTGAEYVTFEKLLSKSDIASINIPPIPNTKGFIDVKEIAQMKDGAMLVKTARGAMIDKAAMADKLYCGKIASVGLDVYENELVANVKLVRNVRALLNARKAVLGERMLSPVPEHVHFPLSG